MLIAGDDIPTERESEQRAISRRGVIAVWAAALGLSTLSPSRGQARPGPCWGGGGGAQWDQDGLPAGDAGSSIRLGDGQGVGVSRGRRSEAPGPPVWPALGRRQAWPRFRVREQRQPRSGSFQAVPHALPRGPCCWGDRILLGRLDGHMPLGRCHRPYSIERKLRLSTGT